MCNFGVNILLHGQNGIDPAHGNLTGKPMIEIIYLVKEHVRNGAMVFLVHELAGSPVFAKDSWSAARHFKYLKLKEKPVPKKRKAQDQVETTP